MRNVRGRQVRGALLKKYTKIESEVDSLQIVATPPTKASFCHCSVPKNSRQVPVILPSELDAMNGCDTTPLEVENLSAPSTTRRPRASIK